jgi:hypothetical protein
MSIEAPINTISNGLVLCLDAANNKSYPGSGTSWVDLSGNGNNGTTSGGPTFNSANGGSIAFDGTDDYVNCGNPLTFTDSFSILFFLKTTSNSVKVACGMYSGAGADWWIGSNTSNTLQFSYGSPSKRDITSTSIINNNMWNMASCVYSKNINSTFLYINTNMEASSNLIPSTVTAAGGQLNIGRFGSTNSFHFPGTFGLFQVYNRALSASEIRQNYDSTRSRFGL